jgi:hypothetical protein
LRQAAKKELRKRIVKLSTWKTIGVAQKGVTKKKKDLIRDDSDEVKQTCKVSTVT